MLLYYFLKSCENRWDWFIAIGELVQMYKLKGISTYLNTKSLSSPLIMSQYLGRPIYTALEPYKHVIWSWYIIQNQTVSATRMLLQNTYPELLACSSTSQNGLISSYFPSMRTLEYALHAWRYSKRQFTNETFGTEEALQQRLWVLFYQYGLNDQEILKFLERDQYYISLSR